MTNSDSQQNSTPLASKPTEVENLIKNADFSAGFEHWTVDDSGNPDNCTLQGSYVVLKNEANITQSVEVERAAPYTLRFDTIGFKDSSGVAEVWEHGVMTHKIYAPSGHHRRSFVTRESTTVADVRFTGTSNEQFFVYHILLSKDVPDPDELVMNGDFEFGSESWNQSGDVRIYEGRCEIHSPSSLAYQQIQGFVPGATYRISCTTLPLEPFYRGAVYLRGNEARVTVIELRANVYEYSYDYQVTSETMTLELDGFDAAYDSVSIKRISVG